MITIDWLKANKCIVFEVVTGSRAYGLNTANSDTDIRGVYIMPRRDFYSLDFPEQVSDGTNDIVYYELRKFIELLSKNNPNILELLNVPDHCILYKHPVMYSIKQDLILSKLCENTFANYAATQIKKAYSLEKKIVNPVDKERKSVTDFCYVYKDKGTVTLKIFMEMNRFKNSEMGLAAVPHLKDAYNLYYSPAGIYNGVVRNDDANDVCLSNVPKEAEPVGLLYFNRDGYSGYCKKYNEYWEWVEKRNPDRYQTTLSHGKKYDSKNMMHVFRLLLMAREIALEGKVNVFRKDRQFLLDVKNGKFEYDDLVTKAAAMEQELHVLYKQSGLREVPNINALNDLLYDMRTQFYDDNETRTDLKINL